MGVILRNMQHLLNLLRPHQARASLKAQLEREIADKAKALEELQASADAADDVLRQGALSMQQAAVRPGNGSSLEMGF